MGGEDVGGNQLVKITRLIEERKGVNDLIGDGSNDSYSINEDDGAALILVGNLESEREKD